MANDTEQQLVPEFIDVTRYAAERGFLIPVRFSRTLWNTRVVDVPGTREQDNRIRLFIAFAGFTMAAPQFQGSLDTPFQAIGLDLRRVPLRRVVSLDDSGQPMLFLTLPEESSVLPPESQQGQRLCREALHVEELRENELREHAWKLRIQRNEQALGRPTEVLPSIKERAREIANKIKVRQLTEELNDIQSTSPLTSKPTRKPKP